MPRPESGLTLATSRAAKVVVAVAALAAAVLIYRWGRGASFFGDEWEFIHLRRVGGVDAFLEPHNAHPTVILLSIYKLMWAVFGLSSYAPYRVLLIVGHLVTAALVFAYARRRVPDLAAALVTIPFLFLGRASEDLLWGFQIAWILSVGSGVAALLLFDRENRRSDWLAGAALTVSVMSSGIGLMFLGGIVIEALYRRGWARWPVAALPLGMFGLWWLAFGSGTNEQHSPKLANLDAVPEYVTEAFSSAVGGVLGWEGTVARACATLVGIVALVTVVRRRDLPPRLVFAAAGGLALWASTALSRAQFQDPWASRYVYPGAAVVLIGVLELVRHVDRERFLVAAAALVAAVAVSGGLDDFREGSDSFRTNGQLLRSQLAGLQIARPDAVAGQLVSLTPPHASTVPAETSRWYEEFDELGVTDWSLAQLTNRPDSERRAADDVVLAAVAFGPMSVNGRTCDIDADAMLLSRVEKTVTVGGLVVMAGDAPVDLRLRRLADSYPESAHAVIASGTSAVVDPPRGTLEQDPWMVQVTSGSPVSICPASE